MSGMRLPGLDVARGGAVLAMFAFHFTWDLGHFGYIDPNFAYGQEMKAFGHAIAVDFLFIAGVSLALAHGDGIRWRAFWSRLALITGAAALVSAGTYLFFPKTWVFFGILHCIGAASLVSLPFLRLAWPAALAGALALGGAPLLFEAKLFDAPALQWVGLSTLTPLTNDYRPLTPWAGALLAGAAFAKARRDFSILALGAGRLWTPLRWLGRHSLGLYLLHQPVFFAAFSVLAALSPPAGSTAGFVAACETHCAVGGAAGDFCKKACVCTAEEASRPGALPEGEGRDQRLKEIAQGCAAKSR